MIPTGGGIALIGLLLIVNGYDWGSYIFPAGMILVLFSWIDRYLTNRYPEEEEL